MLLGMLLVPAYFAAPVAAQDRSVLVERRDGDFTIEQNGDVLVKETWQVQFNGTFRFAFRAIPLDRVNEIDEWSVSENGQVYEESSSGDPYTYELDYTGGERKITWYFEPATDETRTFVLAYRLQGAVRIYEGGDQFWWKFIEADRGYEIRNSTVQVHVPGSFQPNELRASTYEGNTEQVENARIIDGRTIEYTGGSFGEGDVWEIRAQFPHGVVTSPEPSWQAEDDANRAAADAEAARIAAIRPIYDLGFGAGALVAFVGGLLGLYLLWYRRGRDAPVGAIAEFYPKPPEDMPPGVVGTLLDESADMQDILATMIDLARRGYMEIQEQEASSGIFSRSQDFTFVLKEADARSLRPYEQKLLRAIFGKKTSRDMSDLKEKFYKIIPELKEDMYAETVTAGYFREKPNKTRARFGCLGVGLLVLVGVGGFFTVAALPCVYVNGVLALDRAVYRAAGVRAHELLDAQKDRSRRDGCREMASIPALPGVDG